MLVGPPLLCSPFSAEPELAQATKLPSQNGEREGSTTKRRRKNSNTTQRRRKKPSSTTKQKTEKKQLHAKEGKERQHHQKEKENQQHHPKKEKGLGLTFLVGSGLAAPCGHIHLTRHLSHAVHTSKLMCSHTAWLKCLQARTHTIFMPSTSTACVLFPSFSVFLSVSHLFSSTLYLHSDLHSFFCVDSAKGLTCCAFAQ